MNNTLRTWTIAVAGPLFMLAAIAHAEQVAGHVDHPIVQSDSHNETGTNNGTDDFLHHLVEHAKEIGLNPDQLMSVKALRLDFDLARIKVEADIMLTEREIAHLFKDDKAEVTLVEAKIHESEAMRAGLRVASLKTLRRALGLLTPEQREKSRRILALQSKTLERNS